MKYDPVYKKMAKKNVILTKNDSLAHLRAETRAFFDSVTENYELEEHQKKILLSACECWDRVTEAKERIEKDGAYVRDRFDQLKAHPGIIVERDNRTLFARLMRELNLDCEISADNRPPKLKY